MVKLLFLGSGSAFTVGADNYQSNVLLVSESGDRFLIDCGSDIRFSLYELGLSYREIHSIYISHLHTDHVGGLEYIGFNTKFDPNCEKPKLFVSKDIASDIWNKTLSGGMSYVEGDIVDLNTFFDVQKIERGGHFFWQGIEFRIVKVIHVNTGYSLMPTYGLFFTLGGTKIFFTADTQLCWDEVAEYYRQADLIFQDCETSYLPSSVHAHYQQLLELPASIRGKMWLYGYQPGKLPDARAGGFRGFVKKGQSFDF